MRFRSPLLQQLLQIITTEDYLALAMIFTLATLCSGDGGYPEDMEIGTNNGLKSPGSMITIIGKEREEV
jgi:hypothetical protein